MGYAFKDNGREWRMVASAADLLPGEEYSEVEPVKPPPTTEEIISSYVCGVQQRLDAFAKTRGYDNILSAATYATSTVQKFKTEGQYAVEARDATWAKCYEVLDAVQSGQRPMPTLEELISELPVLTWPN